MNELMNTAFKTARNFFNGVAFGITETVPGVSGGTIAIILGFYFDLIRAINNFRREPGKSLRLLVPFALGAAVAIVLFSSIMNLLLQYFSFPTMLLFIGLIVGIIPRVFSRIAGEGRKIGAREILLILLPFPVLIGLANLGGQSVTDPAEVVANMNTAFMFFIFLAGILAAMALVLPGTSGSFILLLLGLYHVVIHSVSSIKLLISDFSDTELLVGILKVLVPLALGVAVGGLSMARLVERLLKTHERTVFCLILGFLSASVVVLFTSPMVYKSGLSVPAVAVGIATFCAGGVASFLLWKKGLQV